MHQPHVVVIGAGIAGAAVAAHLAEHVSVLLLEMEYQPGYHSTGRSAALFAEVYGNETIRKLTRASRDFFYAPPPGFASARLVHPRPVLLIAGKEQSHNLQGFISAVAGLDSLEPKSTTEALELCPILRPEEISGGAVLTRSPADIDVHELHQGYLRLFKARGGALVTDAEVVSLERRQSRWMVTTPRATISSPLLVNAAGAWAGEIANLAGARDIGLQPMRRTACLIDPPEQVPIGRWPMVASIQEDLYFKPDAGMLLVSPADETPTPPCDAQPDEMDIALAIDRLERVTTLQVKRVVRKWAGIRVFVQDRSPVVGFDPQAPGFFWVAALGGFGIQTAPALSRMAASLLLQAEMNAEPEAYPIDLKALAPERIGA